MAVELVTGFAGEPHIDSEDVGAFNAATMGSGSYILTGCAMSMTTVNKLHIAAGELLIQGRHVRITGTGIDLAVANGTSGYNRIDLAVLHYSKASSGVESVAFEVVKGTPTTGTATAPTHAGGSILNGDSSVYVTLAQVAITGLTVGTPEAALATLPSLAALGDSVSQRMSQSKVYTEDALTTNTSWNTIKSADQLADIFGIDKSEIESRLMVSVCNGDFDANPEGRYSWALSSDSGFKVRCLASGACRCRYRIACV